MATKKSLEERSMNSTDSRLSKKTQIIVLTSVFLVSFSLLALEITYTRLASLVLSYHYVFLVISLALLGLGSGGIFIHQYRKKRLSDHKSSGFLVLIATLFVVSIVASVALIYWISIINNIFLYFLVLFVPFFIVGMLFAEVFRQFPSISAKIYGSDLIGAAAGALGAVLILDNLGAINVILLLALIAGIAAMLFAYRFFKSSPRRAAIAIACSSFIAILLVANLTMSFLPNIRIGTTMGKEIHYAINDGMGDGDIIDSRWSSFGRTDLVESSSYPEIMTIYIDGTAGTPMYKFNGNIDDPDPEVNRLKTDFPGYFPFNLLKEEEKNNALIIGPGGGRDVLLALMGGVEDITAVDVNSDLIDIVKDYSAYNGGIYSDFANVNVVVGEGRNFLKSQEESYDVIMLSLPVTKTSRSPDGYALTENYLFTTDSIGDYYDHLTEDGRLIVVAHNEVEISRLFSITAASLEQRGIDNQSVMDHIYVVGSQHFPVFVLKKAAFTQGEMLTTIDALYTFGYFDASRMLNFWPRILAEGNISLDEVIAVYTEVGIDVSPVSDNSPFFYKFEAGVPDSLSEVLWVSLIVVILLLAGPYLFRMKRGENRLFTVNPLWFSVLFVLLGMGFMLAEISLIQKTVLFLGQPVLSLATLLSSLLAGAGTGSMVSSRITANKLPKTTLIISMIIALLLVVYSFLIPVVFNSLLGTGIAIRLLVAVIVLFPLGFCMGFPFPSGLRMLKQIKQEQYIPWMWGLNGISSVLGSVLAIVIAILFGITQALLVAAVCYLLVFVIILLKRHHLRTLPAMQEQMSNLQT